MLETFRKFLGEATPAQRGILAICLEIPFLLAFILAPSVGLVVPSFRDMLVQPVIIAGDVIMGAVVIIHLIILRRLWPRRRSPDVLPGTYAAIALLSTLGFATTALEGGNLTYPTNMIIICLVPCGLMMLDMRATAYALALGLVFILVNDLANLTGLLSYAPGYRVGAFVGDHQRFWAEVLRTGILYTSVTTYGLLIWILFDQVDHNRNALTHLSQTDVLTGLSNRRHFMERLETESRRLGRTQRSFCLVMIDADHFKKINDSHGHLVGDEVLKVIGRVLDLHMRLPADLASRIGGEEFALILPDTTLSGALVVCERIRSSLGELRFQGATTTFGITLSMGVVESLGLDAESLLHYADANLYLAKARGRNCVVSSVPEYGEKRLTADAVA